MLTDAEYFNTIRRESSRFAECMSSAKGSERVPTCPDWNADDLLWHLAEVQLFWAAIVSGRLADPDAAEADKPDRPADHGALLALFEHATATLLEALTSTPRETEVWTWAADQRVAFVIRWQAHEALMHRIDAELVNGAATTIEPALASDGIDAALTLVHGDLPSWSTFTPDGTSAQIEARNPATTWSIELGRFTGTSPNTGNTYDRDILVVVDGPQPTRSFTVRADASELDRWLWGRAPATHLEVDGDPGAFARLEQLVATGIQ